MKKMVSESLKNYLLETGHKHKIPEAEEDWIYMIHHMHKPDDIDDMEFLHHCPMFLEKDEKGKSFKTKHVEDKKILYHVLDIKDLKKAPDFVLDHLNNKYPIEIQKLGKEECAVIMKPEKKIKHDD